MQTLRTLLVGLIMVSTACVIEVEAVEEETIDPIESEGGQLDALESHGGSGFGNGCGYQVIKMPTPSGETVGYLIPLECDPLYIDMGDPPHRKELGPDEEEQSDGWTQEQEQY